MFIILIIYLRHKKQWLSVFVAHKTGNIQKWKHFYFKVIL